MRSCHFRANVRSHTLDSLARVGIHPVVLENRCEPASRRQSIHYAIRGMQEFPDEDILLLEDDIIASKTFPTWVRLAAAQPYLVTFCLLRHHMHPPAVRTALRAGQPIPTGFFPVANIDRWWGSQALFVPARLSTIFVQHFERHGLEGHEGGFDKWVRFRLKELGETAWAAFPNPIQHRDPPRTVSVGDATTGPRVSPTFGLPGTLPLEALQ